MRVIGYRIITGKICRIRKCYEKRGAVISHLFPLHFSKNMLVRLFFFTQKLFNSLHNNYLTGKKCGLDLHSDYVTGEIGEPGGRG